MSATISHPKRICAASACASQRSQVTFGIRRRSAAPDKLSDKQCPLNSNAYLSCDFKLVVECEEDAVCTEIHCVFIENLQVVVIYEHVHHDPDGNVLRRRKYHPAYTITNLKACHST